MSFESLDARRLEVGAPYSWQRIGLRHRLSHSTLTIHVLQILPNRCLAVIQRIRAAACAIGSL